MCVMVWMSTILFCSRSALCLFSPPFLSFFLRLLFLSLPAQAFRDLIVDPLNQKFSLSRESSSLFLIFLVFFLSLLFSIKASVLSTIIRRFQVGKCNRYRMAARKCIGDASKCLRPIFLFSFALFFFSLFYVSCKSFYKNYSRWDDDVFEFFVFPVFLVIPEIFKIETIGVIVALSARIFAMT